MTSLVTRPTTKVVVVLTYLASAVAWNHLPSPCISTRSIRRSCCGGGSFHPSAWTNAIHQASLSGSGDENESDRADEGWLVSSPPLPQPFFPPLTDAELENRKKEMTLIAKLNQGDDKAIALFKDHWFSERGPDARERLMRADFDIGKGLDYWQQAQDTFLDLLKEDWTNLEARARLSKLYCLQGKFEMAKALSLQVLESKPWHFVAMETMTAISMAQGDMVMADLWKARRLPNPSKTEERRQWVERALQDAEAILKRMQEIKDDQEEWG